MFAVDVENFSARWKTRVQHYGSQQSNLGRTKLYQEIKEARLRTVKVGRRTLILVEDLRLWLDSLRATESRG
jgi:hypothetical protein